MDSAYKIKVVDAGTSITDSSTEITKSNVSTFQTNSWQSRFFDASGSIYNRNKMMFYEYNADDYEREVVLPVCKGDVKINGKNIKRIIIERVAMKGQGVTPEKVALLGGIEGSLVLNISAIEIPEVIFRIKLWEPNYTGSTETDFTYTDRCEFYPFSETANIYVPNDKVQKFKDSDSWYIYGRKIKSISSQKTSEENAALGIIGDTKWNLK